MVGKFSDDRKMSGSRIPVLFCWQRGIPHPWSTPNDELRRSIAAVAGESVHSDIGEPGIVGNLLEPAIVQSACDELGLPAPELSPPVFKLDAFETSCDGLVDADVPVVISNHGIVTLAAIDDEPPPEIQLSGRIPIECKVTTSPPTDEVPLYRGPVQLQAQMMATGASAGILVTLHRGIERKIHVYRAEPEIQKQIEDICLDFIARVDAENWFPPVTVDDAVIPPASAEKTTVDVPELAGEIAALESLRDQRASVDAAIEAVEVKIMEALGDAHIGTAGNYVVEWPTRHYKAQPERVTPAKEARTIRLKTLKIRSNV